MASKSDVPEVFKKPLKPLSAQPRFGFPQASSRSDTSSSINVSSAKVNGKAKQVETIDLSPFSIDSLNVACPPTYTIRLLLAAEDDDLLEPVQRTKKLSKESSTSQQDQGLWVEQYLPKDRDSLAVHKKKVSDVASWFDEAWKPKLAKWRRVLVLSGPAGAGKTATVKVLADEMGVEILEWRNGGNWEVANDSGRESIVHRFTSFLAQAGMAPALQLGPDPSLPSIQPKPSTSSHESGELSSRSKAARLILLEDLPNTSHYLTKLAFRSSIQQYLASPRVTCPIVIIISEALSRPGADSIENNAGGGLMFDSRSSDSYDARSVLGNEVLLQPGVREIKFNAIAPTVMKKPLLHILDQVYEKPDRGARGAKPSVTAVEQVIACSNGDLRSALMSLQFLASCDDAKWGGEDAKVKKGKKRKSDGQPVGETSPGKDHVKKLLQFVTSREASLFIFHALGKVLYSKRWNISAEEDKKDLNRSGILQPPAISTPLPKPPRHLRAKYSREPSKVDPDHLFAEAPIDPDVFLSYLHHNYTHYTTSIEQASEILESYSIADSLMRFGGENESSSLRRVHLTGQYSFAVAVRGTLFHLPSPVPKKKQTLRKSEVWGQLKRTRENEGLLYSFASKGYLGEDLKVGKATRVDRAPLVGRMMRDKGSGGGVPRHAAFLVQLATFPTVSMAETQMVVRGEALEEKETLDEEEEEPADDDDRDEPMDHAFEEVLEEEEWYDPDDDIEE
ncbi:BQ5605_C005g03277 [Microbotryum silenes-dioicae]|uniref:BQ5605_C005g03277 protein n=1 Tax=Microbotryum silenes-dioicae TaxID=796604 RepID=A0A2X0PCF3_9BASI|nr:BQ5605_C005g03277 [Microbotryum silenes-dioicae]